MHTPLTLALDDTFDAAELELVIAGFDAWGLTIASLELLSADAPAPAGAFVVARCAELTDPREGELAGAQHRGAIALKAPLVTRGVVAHEVGHALGLGHSDNPADVMHAPITSSAPSSTELARR